ncbi:unnamed protein product [marine sediment metagenome]|uniref:Uncharacterized protein n=1 Tax=marine sediment metagenome TaxID=412755 RepID=X1V8Q7_9ZZZZ
MGVKRKIKRKGKVIDFEEKIGLYYDGGIYAIADETGFSIDEVFLMLLKLCLHGLIEPIEIELPNDRLRLNFRVARSEREVEQMRSHMIKHSRIKKEEFGLWAELRDEFFGEPPERPDKKG